MGREGCQQGLRFLIGTGKSVRAEVFKSVGKIPVGYKVS